MVVEEVGIFATLLKELPALAAVLTGVIILGYLLYTRTQQITQKNYEANQQITQKNEEANQLRYAELVKSSQDRYAELVKSSQDRYEELTTRYIESMNKVVGDNTICMNELCSKIDAQRDELKQHTNTKDRALEMLYNKDKTIQDLYEMLKDQIKHPSKSV